MEYLTIKEVTLMFRISRTTLWRLESAGRFPKGTRISKRKKVWRKKDLESWLMHSQIDSSCKNHRTHPQNSLSRVKKQ